jgi:hypothetical protein
MNKHGNCCRLNKAAEKMEGPNGQPGGTGDLDVLRLRVGTGSPETQRILSFAFCRDRVPGSVGGETLCYD